MTDKPQEQEIETGEVGEEALEDVSGGAGEGSGGASMEINSPGYAAGQVSVNYP